MTGFEWLVVGLGLAVVAWLVYRTNQITPPTGYDIAEPVVAKQSEPTAEKKPAKKAAAKKPAAKKKK